MTTVTGYLTNTDPAWARRSWQGEPALAVDFGAQEATGRTCVTDAKAATGVVHVTLDVPEEPHPLEGWHTGWRRPPWPGPCARPTRVDDLDLPRARQERQALAHGRWPWPCAGCAAGMVEASKQFRRGDGHLHLPSIPMETYLLNETLLAKAVGRIAKSVARVPTRRGRSAAEPGSRASRQPENRHDRLFRSK